MYRRDAKQWLKHLDFILLDLMVLQMSFVLGYVLRHGWVNPYRQTLYANMALILMLWDLVVIFFAEPFHNVLKRGFYREFVAVLRQSALLGAFAVFYLFLRKSGAEYSRSSMLFMGCAYVLLSYGVRLCWKQVLKKFFMEGSRSLLVVAAQENAEGVIGNLRGSNYGTFRFAGLILVDGNNHPEAVSGVQVVADGKNASSFAQRAWVDEVFVSVPESCPFPQELIDDFVEMGVTVHLDLPRISSVPGKQQIVEKMGNYTVLTTSMNYATTGQSFTKRAMDILGGLVGSLICVVLFLFLAPAIYISSPGPVIFKQERVGKNGKRFYMYKFRSMYPDAEERRRELLNQNKMDSDLMFKLDFDPRIIGNRILPDGTRKTGLGQFLRSTSLDEFPQFFNVLKGDMSLVGTRPPLVSEFEAYQQHHRARMAIKPGITGLWQVSGRSEITDFEEVIALDTKYINEWSVGQDIKIILQTVIAVLRRKGSV